jgi:acetyltransferase-like isoleucine patch superfamily enzyme
VNGLGKNWRLVLSEWGPDVEKTKRLISDLGLNDLVFWEKLCSKPLLRKRQQAADLTVDQFVMEGYGTSVLESMAAGKPVIMAPMKIQSQDFFLIPPPFIGSTQIDEIHDALLQAQDNNFRAENGKKSLDWVRTHHGYQRIASLYINAYLRTLKLSAIRPTEFSSEGPVGLNFNEIPYWQIHAERKDSEPYLGLMEKIVRLHHSLRDKIMQQYDRSLPLGEELTDRWERARYLGFGEGTSIYDSALVIGKVKVGKNTWIGPGCILDGSGGLEIGSNCSIAAGCHLYSHDSVEWALSGGVKEYKRASTRIGDACYIGPYSVISAGVTIGKHCLISALSLVKEAVPDNTFVGGIPAKSLGMIKVGLDSKITVSYENAD